MFAATPFLIPDVADRYHVALGTAGLISAAQVFGFAAAVFVAGRRLRPSRRVLVVAGVSLAALDSGSALISTFELLLALRLLAGAAAGLFTWMAWADAMRAEKSMRDIAAVGPLTVLVGAPLLAWIGSLGGDRAIYACLAFTPLAAVIIPVVIDETPLGGRRRFSPSRSNVVLLAALGVMTMAGSAFFVFLAAFAESEVGMGDVALSLGFSVNAVTGLMGARFRRRPAWAWPWLAGIVVSVMAIGMVRLPALFFVGMAGWGFCFWMAVPRVLGRIADWSYAPDERGGDAPGRGVGDAQEICARGVPRGPAVASLLVGPGRYAGLIVFSSVGLAGAAGVVGGVERYRTGRDGPVA